MLIFLSNLGMGGTTNEAVVVTDTWVALSSPTDSYVKEGGVTDSWVEEGGVTDSWVN